MENLEIINVVRTAEQDSDWLLAYAIDKPKKGTTKDVAAIDVLGWIVGKKSPVVAVEVMSGDRLLRKIPIDIPRDDVGKRFSTVPEAKNSGFEATVELIGLENPPQPPLERGEEEENPPQPPLERGEEEENPPQPPLERGEEKENGGFLILEAVFQDETRLKIGEVSYKLESYVEEVEEVPVEETVAETEIEESLDLEKIKGDLERSRAFLKKMEEDLEGTIAR